MGELRELIDKLEKLDGPSREVDAEIMFDLFATPVGKHKEDGGPIGYIRLDDQPSWNLGLRFPGKDREWFQATRKQIKGETLLVERDGAYVLMNSLRVPEITASLDAAIALCERVLPGWFWRVGRTSLFPNGWAYISRMHPDHCTEKDEASCSDGKAATPAIALILATLRAKAQEAGR